MMRHSRTRTFVIVLATAIGVSALAGGCTSTGQHPALAPPDRAAAPSDLRWETYRGVPVPVGDEGPAHVDGPIATGYDLSPAGAALAAIQASIRMAVAGDTDWPQVGRRLLVPGTGRDRWAIARAQVSIPEPAEPSAAPLVLGYTITSYSPARAGVDVYTRQPDGSVARNSTAVTRSGEDWLLELPAKLDRPLVAAVAATPRDMVALPRPGVKAGR